MQPDSRIGTESAHYGTGILVLNDRNCQFSEEKINVVLNLRGQGGPFGCRSTHTFVEMSFGQISRKSGKMAEFFGDFEVFLIRRQGKFAGIEWDVLKITTPRGQVLSRDGLLRAVDRKKAGRSGPDQQPGRIDCDTDIPACGGRLRRNLELIRSYLWTS